MRATLTFVCHITERNQVLERERAVKIKTLSHCVYFTSKTDFQIRSDYRAILQREKTSFGKTALKTLSEIEASRRDFQPPLLKVFKNG
jgi:hypothetical protein